MNVPVIHYESEWVPNSNPRGETPLEEFWEVRGAVLAASQKFGETGPESKTSPWYYLIEDQYNDELYQHMEVYEPAGWTNEWLRALVGVLREHRGWGIGINVNEGYLMVFGDRLMVNGPAFAHCHNLEAVVSAAREATERFNERKYGPLKKQLQYIQKQLPSAMREVDTNGFAHMATFDGYELFEGQAVWVLQASPESRLRPEADVGCFHGRAVSADGVIHPQYCEDFSPYSDAEPPYWLLTYLIEDKTQNAFELLDENEKPVGTIRIGPLISDGDLDKVCGTKSL